MSLLSRFRKYWMKRKLSQLVIALQSVNMSSREPAARTLIEMGDTSVIEAMAVLLAQGDWMTAGPTLYVLCKIGTAQTFGPLVRYLKHPYDELPQSGRMAADALWAILVQNIVSVSSEDLQAVLTLHDSIVLRPPLVKSRPVPGSRPEWIHFTNHKELARQELIRRGEKA